MVDCAQLVREDIPTSKTANRTFAQSRRSSHARPRWATCIGRRISSPAQALASLAGSGQIDLINPAPQKLDASAATYLDPYLIVEDKNGKQLYEHVTNIYTFRIRRR